MRTIGLIGGMSWQSSKLYYERINALVAERLGGLHSAKLIMHSIDFAPVAVMQAEDRWADAADLLASAAQSLERAGADCIAIGANTMHKVAREVKAATRLPLIHIIDATANALRADGRSRPLLLGTRYTMEDWFFTEHLQNKGLDPVVPDKPARDALHAAIYDELVKGIVTEAAIARTRETILDAGMDGADSVIFGCTEIGMMFPPTDAGLPGYDTLELHAEALVEFALKA
jgi:aspartate racemase